MTEELLKLDKRHTKAVAELLAGAFADDPFLSYLIPDAAQRRGALPSIYRRIAELDMATCDCYAVSENMEGCVIVKRPGARRISPAAMLTLVKCIALPLEIAKHASLRALMQRAWAVRRSVSDMRRCIRSLEPCLYIEMIAVDVPYRHRGHMSRMMRSILLVADGAGLRCVLETESEQNTSIYRHFGFAPVNGIEAVPGGLTYYVMAREPVFH